MAELVRQCVENMLRTMVASDTELRRKKALEIAGSLEIAGRLYSGKSDNAGKHDLYLAGASGDRSAI